MKIVKKLIENINYIKMSAKNIKCTLMKCKKKFLKNKKWMNNFKFFYNYKILLG